MGIGFVTEAANKATYCAADLQFCVPIIEIKVTCDRSYQLTPITTPINATEIGSYLGFKLYSHNYLNVTLEIGKMLHKRNHFKSQIILTEMTK